MKYKAVTIEFKTPEELVEKLNNITKEWDYVETIKKSYNNPNDVWTILLKCTR